MLTLSQERKQNQEKRRMQSNTQKPETSWSQHKRTWVEQTAPRQSHTFIDQVVSWWEGLIG